MIKTDNLKYSYRESQDHYLALAGIDLHIEDGEFVAIIGHNGSGKSTLAKMFNGTLLPEDGTVLVTGMDTKDGNLIWEIRKNAGMVFQNPDNQIVATVVEEDVAFGPENLGIEPLAIRKRVDEALKTVGMFEHRKKPPHLLSGGQKQRVAIAGILAMQPKCIIFDEPTAMLDPAGRREVMATIQQLHESGITIVHITHFMDEAILADRVIVIEEGKIHFQGTPKDVFSQVERLQDMGLDVPQVTMIAFELRKNGIKIPDNILDVNEMVDEICRLL